MSAPTRVSGSVDDAERIAVLRSYEVLDTPPELVYDEITELAAQICGCPIATISLIDERRDWLKSKYGLPPEFTEAPRELTACYTTILGGDLLTVPDLRADERFAGLPAVVGEPHFRFYSGMPLINSEGYALGTLCVLDFQPRELASEQAESLRRLSRQIVGQLELRRALLEAKRAMRELGEARKEIESERAKSDLLLLKILPRSVADELKENNKVAPRFWESATIVFVDFEGFTKLAERIEPRGLVDQLDQFFSAFDEIAERHRLEMLKTIGDAYMCVGGLPEPNRTHPVDACLAALEIIDYMDRANRQRERARMPRWEIRVGLHTGPVMAGVVGRRKFIYDVWGDAVNVAARLEAAGAAGQVNLSEAACHRVRDLFDFEPRGTVEVKNKGPLKMFFLVGIRRELARDQPRRLPNDAFHREAARLFPGYAPV
jgi:class 3 adenylate cyclase